MIYPPLKVIEQWRDEGIPFAEIQDRCIAYNRKRREKKCKLCEDKHWARGYCQKHYYSEYYKKVRKLKILTKH